MQPNETHPSENQLSIALCRDVNMTIWQRNCDGMMSVFVINYCCCVTLMKDYDNWTERVFDDQMTEWGLDCRWPGQWSGPWHDYCPHTWGIISQPDIIVVIIVRRFGWKLWQSLPRWAQRQVTLLLIIQQSLRSAAPWLNVIINTRTLNNKMIIFHWEINISRWTDSNNAETRRQG